MPDEAVSGREVLKGSPGPGREGKQERRQGGMEAVTAVPTNNREKVRPWEKVGCGSSSLLHQQAVEQALITSELQKFCGFPPPRVEFTVYTWILCWTGFVQRQEWKSNLKIQILSQKHFWKNEDFEKVEEWAKDLAVST